MKCAHKNLAYSASSLTQITVRNDFCGVFRLKDIWNHFFTRIHFTSSYFSLCVCVSLSCSCSLILTIRSKLPFQSKGIRLFMCDTWTWMMCCFALLWIPHTHTHAHANTGTVTEGIKPKNKDAFANNKCSPFQIGRNVKHIWYATWHG